MKTISLFFSTLSVLIGCNILQAEKNNYKNKGKEHELNILDMTIRHQQHLRLLEQKGHDSDQHPGQCGAARGAADQP